MTVVRLSPESIRIGKEEARAEQRRNFERDINRRREAAGLAPRNFPVRLTERSRQQSAMIEERKALLIKDARAHGVTLLDSAAYAQARHYVFNVLGFR